MAVVPGFAVGHPDADDFTDERSCGRGLTTRDGILGLPPRRNGVPRIYVHGLSIRRGLTRKP